jgi:hypothetical protein
MTSNDDGLDPAGDGTGDPFEDDGFTEYRSSENITDLSDQMKWRGRCYTVSATETT